MTSRRTRPDAAEQLELVASVVQRLAVLLAAGVPPVSAWGYLVPVPESSADAPADHDVAAPEPPVAAIVAAVQQRVPVDEAILAETAGAAPDQSAGWRGLAAAWRVATDAGAPLAPTLDDFAGSLRDLAQTRREVQVALAAPIATAKMVMALPAVGVLFGFALGFDTVGTLFGTPVGLACLVGGSLLMLAARRWNRVLVRGAEPAMQTPGLALDLVAIAVSGGTSTQRAVHAVEAACELASIALTDDRSVFGAVFALSTRAGVPAAGLLRSEAAEARRRARSDGARRAATLSVTLMLPLGLCILPAFMLLGVAPLLIAVISSTVAGL